MGFVVLAMALVIGALLRTRIPPRKSGPLVEWGAFKEPSYMLFTFGIFLLYWTLYFAFFYVSLSLFQCFHSPYTRLRPRHRFKCTLSKSCTFPSQLG